MTTENRTDFDQVVRKITQNYISDEVFVTRRTAVCQAGVILFC